MAIERLKFRCYRCNQLLGATPNKAGSVVTCPKCSAELLIPIPELRPDEGSDIQEGAAAPAPAPAPARTKVRAEARPKPDVELRAPNEPAAAATAAGPVSRPSAAATSVDELEAMLPPDLIDLRPEDLRVEAEFFESLTRQPSGSAVREPAPWPPPAGLGPSLGSATYVSPSPASPVVASYVAPSAPAAPQSLTETIDLAPKAPEPPAPPPVPARVETALIGAAIEIERPTILPPGTETRRVRDVILPASVVLSWSLFVLLGIALAFVAGLLMGHFLWTTHP